MRTIYDISTIKAGLLYILERVPDNHRSIYFIVKAMFYAQKHHLANYGSPLFEDDICALPFGPVPSIAYNILKCARGEQMDDIRLIAAAKSILVIDENFYPVENADMDDLSKSAILSLESAIAEIATKSFNDVCDATHESKEYQDAYKFGTGRKVMNPANIARDAGADEAIQEYITEYVNIKLALG